MGVPCLLTLFPTCARFIPTRQTARRCNRSDSPLVVKQALASPGSWRCRSAARPCSSHPPDVTPAD